MRYFHIFILIMIGLFISACEESEESSHQNFKEEESVEDDALQFTDTSNSKASDASTMKSIDAISPIDLKSKVKKTKTIPSKISHKKNISKAKKTSEK